MDYTSATSVDRAELLEIQNLELRKQVIRAEQEALAQRLLRKYGTPDQENLTVRGDGTINRTGTPVPPVATETAETAP